MNSGIICNPVIKSQMIFMSEKLLTINFKEEKPNSWWRFWQWLLLGIKWKDYKGE